jgi:hypothetical protein
LFYKDQKLKTVSMRFLKLTLLYAARGARCSLNMAFSAAEWAEIAHWIEKDDFLVKRRKRPKERMRVCRLFRLHRLGRL